MSFESIILLYSTIRGEKMSDVGELKKKIEKMRQVDTSSSVKKLKDSIEISQRYSDMIENFDEAMLHPNTEDLNNAREFALEVLGKLEKVRVRVL